MFEHFYRVSNVVLKVEHDGDELFTALAEDLKAHAIPASAQVDCTAHLKSGCKEFRLPEKSVLVGHWPKAREARYQRNGSLYTERAGEALVATDFQNRRVDAHYSTSNKAVRLLARNALKWLIIKTAEAHSNLFLHASSVVFANRTVLFAGHSGCGKSSCLLRLMAAGGQVIADDVTLVHEHRLVPFNFRLHLKGDIARRQNLDPSHDRYELGTTRPEVKQGIDYVIFPQVWHHETSETKAATPHEALRRLMEIYVHEASWNAYPEDAAEYEQQYGELLSRAQCFEFFAGVHEREVTDTLLDFFTMQEHG
ncbi:MAG: hypothetical protein P8R42_08485 [Candidatus Binatia bacterium]|nr:hypothetical protein [Candidatus Binatia bacterium]